MTVCKFLSLTIWLLWNSVNIISYTNIKPRDICTSDSHIIRVNWSSAILTIWIKFASISVESAIRFHCFRGKSTTCTTSHFNHILTSHLKYIHLQRSWQLVARLIFRFAFNFASARLDWLKLTWHMFRLVISSPKMLVKLSIPVYDWSSSSSSHNSTNLVIF